MGDEEEPKAPALLRARLSVVERGDQRLAGPRGGYEDRIERDNLAQPKRLFPFTREKFEGPRLVAIDPRVQFGRPCLVGSGVPTDIIAQRFKAGDSTALLAEDYRRKVDEIEEAIRYETELKAAA